MRPDGAQGADESRSDDLALESLHARSFDLVLPERQRVPFVFASPHSGRVYPRSFTLASRLSALGLRRSEDAFVDDLFASAVELGAPMIAARFPRAYLDANRAPEWRRASVVRSLLAPSGATIRTAKTAEAAARRARGRNGIRGIGNEKGNSRSKTRRVRP